MCDADGAPIPKDKQASYDQPFMMVSRVCNEYLCDILGLQPSSSSALRSDEEVMSLLSPARSISDVDIVEND